MPLINVADQASKNQAREQARRAANDQPVRLFKSYPEAELHGFYSLKRLRQMGLEVREREHWNYLYVVATRYGNLPVFSREQARDSRAPDPVPGPGEAPSLDPIGVEILLPEEEPTTSIRAALCGQNCLLPGSSRQTGSKGAHQRTSQAPEHRLLHRHAREPGGPRVPQGRGERDPPHPPRRQVGHRPARAPGRRGRPLQPPLGQEAHGRKGREQGVQVAHRQRRADMRRPLLLPSSRRSQVLVLQVVLRPFPPREMAQVGDHQAQACRQAPSRPVAKDGSSVSKAPNGYGTDG